MDAKPITDESSPFDDGELYDILFKDFAYAIDFYVGLAREATGPVLDIGCGTGRVLLPCMQAGVDMDGLDLSEAMLNTLRTKAAALQLVPRVYTADMSDFRLPRRYALIMITFNAFIHNLTQEAQVRCLELCRQHLMPGGVLAFDTFFPGLGIIGAPENTRVLELETHHPETGLPLRLYDTRSFDRVEQIQRSLNEVEIIDADGNVKTVHRSEFSVRWTYKAEMALLLRVAGFARWDIFGGFDRRPLAQETDAMIVLAWADGEKVRRARGAVIREVFPYLHVRGAAAAIDFYKRVFGAEELLRLSEPNGRIGHAELKLGPVTLMLADEHPDYGIQSPLAFGGTGTTIHLHVENVDTLAQRAVQAGATMVKEPADQAHGERQCRVRDPFGHEWLLGHETEEVSPEEMQRRF